MQTRLIDSREELLTVRNAWTGLESNSLLPTQHFIWAEACAATLAREGELRIIVLEDGGQTVAIAPLVHRKESPSLETLGMAEFYEPTDVICSSPEVLPPLANAVAGLGIPLLLKRVPADSPLPEALRKAFRLRGALISRPDNPWPGITLDPSWVEPECKFNSKRRAYLRRARRLAEEFGAVTSEVLSPAPVDLAPLLEEALAVEASGWKGKTRTALALDPLRGAFYRHYAAAACEKGILRLCFLRISGRAVAMQLGIETGDGLYLLKIGYDEQFAHCSPGSLLVREAIQYAARRGLKSIVFLGAMEPWKEQWTSEKTPCVVLHGYPLGFRGTATLAGDLARYAWHRLIPPATSHSRPV